MNMGNEKEKEKEKVKGKEKEMKTKARRDNNYPGKDSEKWDPRSRIEWIILLRCQLREF